MSAEETKTLVAKHLGDKVSALDTGRYDPIFEVKPENLVEICRTLRDHEELRFDFFCNMGGVDTGERMEAVYSIASTKFKMRVDIKIVLPRDGAEIDSVQEVWAGANWFERELWELYGVNVRNHGNLTRFLLPDDWDQGHPMRKDWDAPDFVRMPEL